MDVGKTPFLPWVLGVFWASLPPRRSGLFAPWLWGLGLAVGMGMAAMLGIVLAAEEKAQGVSPPPRPAPWRPQESAELPVDPEHLGFEEIVFVKRRPYSSDHYYTDINNGTAPDRFDPRNGIYIYNLRTRTERPVVTAAQLPGGKGFIGYLSLSFDAKRVLFDFREHPGAGFRIWEVGLDGSGLRQVLPAPPDEA
ncbi:MAG TPA: hypothetical protein PLQ00_15325, partial [Thermoguttaceae bacterium]|nr:hypothetical protein [Thermoguttaceae bacterium]